jgi:gliding motility-associated lipoprotein GldH
MKKLSAPMLNRTISLFLLACLFAQCGRLPHYEKNFDLPNGNWTIKNELKFKIPITDASQRYNIAYNLRNTLKYPYSNLYVTYYLEDSKGKPISTELQNISLFDAKRGKPFGSGLGDTFTHQLPIPTFQKYKFPKADTYTFRIVQYMRQDPLPGILTMGIRVETE